MRFWTRQTVDVDTLIKPPRILFAKSDESLRERTWKRRQAADSIRRRAAGLDAGAKVSDVLRAVK